MDDATIVQPPVTIETEFDITAFVDSSSGSEANRTVFLSYRLADSEVWVPVFGKVDWEQGRVTAEVDHLSWWKPATWGGGVCPETPPVSATLPEDTDPVIIIPGILGAWPDDEFQTLLDASPFWAEFFGLELAGKFVRLACAFYPEEVKPLNLLADGGWLKESWWIASDYHGGTSDTAKWWAALVDAGYVPGENLFIFPYWGFDPIDGSAVGNWSSDDADRGGTADWTAEDTWAFEKRFTDLGSFIEKVKSESGRSRVDLVAHSMGGVVARTYVARRGGASVDQLITFGSPHHGVPGTYPFWEGGEWSDWFQGELASFFTQDFEDSAGNVGLQQAVEEYLQKKVYGSNRWGWASLDEHDVFHWLRCPVGKWDASRSPVCGDEMLADPTPETVAVMRIPRGQGIADLLATNPYLAVAGDLRPDACTDDAAYPLNHLLCGLFSEETMAHLAEVRLVSVFSEGVFGVVNRYEVQTLDADPDHGDTTPVGHPVRWAHGFTDGDDVANRIHGDGRIPSWSVRIALELNGRFSGYLATDCPAEVTTWDHKQLAEKSGTFLISILQGMKCQPLADLVVVGESALLSVRGGGIERLIESDEIAIALSDTAGGVVFQEGADSFPHGGGPIWWLAAEDEEPRQVVDAETDERLRLHDVAVIDGIPNIIYTVGYPPTAPDGSFDESYQRELLMYQPLTGTSGRFVAQVGGWEWGTDRISYGGGVFMFQKEDQEGQELVFLDGVGLPVEFPIEPVVAACTRDTVDDRCPVGTVISSDGSQLAYVAANASSSAELVVVDLASGKSSEPIELPFEVSDEVVSLDFHDNLVAVSRTRWDSDLGGVRREPALLVDTADRKVDEVVDTERGKVHEVGIFGVASIDVLNVGGVDPVGFLDVAAFLAATPDALAFSSAPSFGEPSQIWVAKPDGTQRQQLTSTGDGASLPAWSPDGSNIAYYSSGLYVMSVVDGSTRLLARNALDFRAAWSPEGDRLAFTAPGPERGADIWIVNLDGTGLRNLTQGRPGTQESSPTWRSDGSLIAFESISFDDPSDSDIEVVGADGTGRRTVVGGPSNDAAPAWSPAGSELLFVSPRSGGVELWTTDENAAGPYRLPAGAGASGPAWTPDGAKIVFSSVGDLYSVDADGTSMMRLGRSDSWDDYPSWRGTVSDAPTDAEVDVSVFLGVLAPYALVTDRFDVDMDGDGEDEVVLLFDLLPECPTSRPFIGVYDRIGDEYKNVVAADVWGDVSAPWWLPGTPPTTVPDCDEAFTTAYTGNWIGAEPFDFTGDGSVELALNGIAGPCGTCDLSVGILDLVDGTPVLLFERSSRDVGDVPHELTTAPGELTVSGLFKGPDDANCCPSFTMEYRVVFDSGTGRGQMVDRTTTAVSD